MICPNISHPDWKEMVHHLGEENAYLIFALNQNYLNDDTLKKLAKVYNTHVAYLIRANQVLNEQKSFLPELNDEDYNDISSISDIMIDGITPYQQFELMQTIGQKIIRTIFEKDGIKGDVVNEIFSSYRKGFEKWYLEEDNEELKQHYESILNGWEKIKKSTMYYIQQASSVSIKDSDTESENFDNSESDLDWFSKISFDESSLFQIDFKNNASGKVKEAFHFIRDGKNYLGFDKYVNYHEVFSGLMEASVNEDGTPLQPDWHVIRERLLTSGFAWMPELVAKVDSDIDLQNQLVPIITQHRTNMKTIIYKDWEIDMQFGQKELFYNFQSFVLDSNLSTSIKQTIRNFTNDIDIFDDQNRISIEKIDSILNVIEEMAEKKKVTAEDFQRVFDTIGIDASPLTTVALADRLLYNTSNKRVATTNAYFTEMLFKNLADRLKNIKNSINEKSDDIDYRTIENDADWLKLARLNNKYRRANNNLSFTTGGLTIVNNSPNRYHVLKTRDLKTNNKNFRENLKKLPFNNGLLVKLFDTYSNFGDVFNYSYLDVAKAIKKLRSKSKKKTKLSKLGKKEHEIVKIQAYLNGMTKKKMISSDNKPSVNLRVANYFYQTMSDKSSMLMHSSLAFDVNSQINENGQIDMSDTAANKLFSIIVMPELKRIFSELQRDTDSTITGYQYSRFLIHNFPTLNFIKGLWVESTDTDGNVHKDVNGDIEYILSDQAVAMIMNNESNDLKKEMVEAFKKALLTDAENTYEQWEKWFLNDKVWEFIPKSLFDGNHVTFPDWAKTKEQKMMHFALDFAVNYQMHNIGLQQVFTKDPALYWKPSNRELKNIKISQIAKASIDSKLRDAITNAIEDSNTNAHKRYAMDNSPGLQGNRKGFIKYTFLEDVERDVFLESIDETIRVNYTDAQEFVSWQEHLDFDLSYGKITKAQHEKLSKILTEQEEYANRNEVIPKRLILSKKMLGSYFFGAVKPVYTEDDFNTDENVANRIFVKSSAIPLLPQFTQGTENDKLRKFLYDNNIQRAPFASAVKVGSTSNFTRTDENGNYALGDTFMLDVEGLKLQQEVPVKKSNEIGIGSQISKVYAADFHLVDGFQYQSQSYNGEQLDRIFQKKIAQVHKIQEQKLLDEVVTNGKIDLERLQKIISDEVISRGYHIALLESIKLENGSFKTPLWFLDKRFQALLTSIVDNRVRKIYFPGFSSPLATENGMEVTTDYEKYKDVIVRTDNYDGGKLKSHRYEDGVFKPSQIIVAWNFKDQDGKPIPIEPFLKENGTIDFEKLPPKFLQAFGFRIPTQGPNSSMSFEIVGFLPQGMRNILITSGDVTQQMGSDFDIDKLYSYMYKTRIKYNEELQEETQYFKTLKKAYLENKKNLSKEISDAIEYLADDHERYSNRFNDLASLHKLAKDKLKNEHYEDFLNLSKSDIERINKARYKNLDKIGISLDKDILISFKNIIRDYNASVRNYESYEANLKVVKDTQTNNENLDEIIQKIAENNFNQYESFEIDNDLEEDRLKNELIEIHHAFVSNPHPLVALKVTKPLDDYMKQLKQTAEEIYSKRKKKLYLPLSSDHNRDKFFDASVGKTGVGKFSLDAVFISIIQSKNISTKPVNIKIGREITNGYYSFPLTLSSRDYLESKGFQPTEKGLREFLASGVTIEDVKNLSFKSDNIKAFQSAALDHEKEQIMNKINVNSHTFSATAYLLFEGFSLPTISKFMTIPIIEEWVDAKANHQGSLSKFKTDEEIYEMFEKKYQTPQIELEQDDTFEISELELDNIPDNKKLLVLRHFITMTDKGRAIESVQQAINTDSSGVPITMNNVEKKIDAIKNLYLNSVQNALSLLGTVETSEDSSLKDGQYIIDKIFPIKGEPFYVKLTPNNISGSASTSALFTTASLFKNFFPAFSYSLSQMKHDLAPFFSESYVRNDLSEQIVDDYKDFLFSSLIKNSISERNVLIHSNYLHNAIRTAKQNFPSNTFLQKLELEKEGNVFKVNFSNSIFNDYDIVETYKHFIHLFALDFPIDEFSKITYRDLAIMLIKYNILYGNDVATSFREYFPPNYLEKIGFLNMLRELDFNDLPNISNFETAFVLNNQESLQLEEGLHNEGSIYPKGSYSPEYIAYKQSIFKKINDEYVLIQHGKVNVYNKYDFNKPSLLETIETFESPFLKSVAKRLAALSKAEYITATNLHGLNNNGQAIKANGIFYPRANVIMIEEMLEGERKEVAIVHELTHSVLDKFIQSNHPEAKKLKSIHKAYSQYAKNNETAKPFRYATTSPKEFLAMFMSNEAFREHLDSIPFEKKTFLQRVKEIFLNILKTLGFDHKTGQRLSEFIQQRVDIALSTDTSTDFNPEKILKEFEDTSTTETPTQTSVKTINVYWGQAESETSTKILSNLAPRKFTFEGREYGSVEHAYQSNKSGTFDEATYNAYLKLNNNFEVKNLFTVEPIQAADKKAKAKAKIATQYIGFAEGITGSSTALYSQQANEEYNKALLEANKRPNTTNIPQNLQSGVEQYGTLQYANKEAQELLGKNASSIELIENGFRTRTTRTDKELEKYDIKVGSYIKMFGKNQFGNVKNIIVKITKITKGYDDATWYKEGWTEEGLEKLKAHTNSANAVEFEVVKSIVNSGNYSSTDVIFVSVGGKRGDVNLRKTQQDKTIKEAIKALDAGATLITDNAAYVESNSYNEGEKRLAANLKAKGYNYSETTVDGNLLGVWNKNTNTAYDAYLKGVSQNVSINKDRWTKDSPKQNPNTAYVFTENINSIGSSRIGGGSAVIRNNPNAIGIVTKKYYVYSEDRATSNVKGGWNQDFKNTDSDFELFKEVNIEQFKKLDKFSSKIFPDSFANSLASIPNRFALWLQNELLVRYGLVTEINNSGTGLISKSITSLDNISNAYGTKIRGKGTVAEMKAANSLGLMKKLVVESFKQNPNSEAAKKLLQYENFTHNTNELIDEAFLEGLKLAQEELRKKNNDKSFLPENESDLSPTTISSNIFELEPDISEEKIKTIYKNYVNLMNKQREGKALSLDMFKNLLSKYQVYRFKNTYIFGQYDTNTATFITRLNSSPSSKELLAEAIPNIVNKGIDFISFVPKDYADKLVRSGYVSSVSSFEYDFKGEVMQKYAVASNINVFSKIFNKNETEITSEEIEMFNESVDLKYTPVEIKAELIEQAGKEVSQILETYLNQFGIVVKDIEQIKDKLGIDELGFADILSKIAYVKDKKDLPPIAGEFIAYMMQYNPLVQQIINELIQTEAIQIPKNLYTLTENGSKKYNYKKLDKTEFFKYIGTLIVKDLENKLDGNYSKSLIDKIKELIKTFFDYITKSEIDKINKNIGIISNNILQQNKKLITSSLYKPGAYGKPTKQVSLQEALDSDLFGSTIIHKLSNQGFILTGSTSLGEQGTIQRPEENLLHDIDWVSPFNRDLTKKKFLEEYPNALFIRDIYGEGYVTDSWLITPEGYSIANFKTVQHNEKIIIESYDVIDNNNNIVGTYKLQKQKETNQNEEIVTGIEAKIIDFFSFDVYDQEPSVERLGINLANWKEIFKAKIAFARYKDIWDYNRFIPNDNINSTFNNTILKSQKPQESNDFNQFQESLNKPNTNPKLLGNQQEQIKKFAELQERLNNKEFIEGAKNAYENSEGSNVITPNDKIVFGHPGIGKTYLKESGRTDVIDFDSDYKGEINEQFNLPKGFKARNDFQKSNKEEYQEAVRKLWIKAKQEAIKKWGSEEALVQSIGEQVVLQKGEALNWWNNFVKWIMNQFNSLSKLEKQELTQILTDAFLTRQDLSTQDFVNNNDENWKEEDNNCKIPF